jgi:molybdate transport system ATP-binding protein
LSLLFHFQHVSIRKFGKTILSDINWAVRTGEHWAVVGPNGSGKSTLVEAMVGKGWIAEGKVHFGSSGENDDRTFDLSRIGLVSTAELAALVQSPDRYYQQRFNSLDSESAPLVKEALLGKSPDQTTSDRLNQVAETLGIQHLLDRRLIKLSNGETKRMLIAKALIQQPAVLILDNPFIGLDSQARETLKDTINQVAQSGTQVILIASPEELPEAITHVIQLNDGRVKSTSDKSAFLSQWKQNCSHVPKQSETLVHTDIPSAASKEPYFQIAVEMRNVNVNYGDASILKDVSWTVKKGEKWALLGPNGSGKSTLLSLINGDNPQAYANDITLFDRQRGSGESIWDIKKQIGFISPELHLYYPAVISCFQVVASGHFDQMGEEYSAFRRSYTDDQIQQAKACFHSLDIAHLMGRSFSEVSVGEQRLVLLARVLVKDPPLLILDEPCQGLDEAHREHFKVWVDRVCHNPYKTLIYVTHYAAEIPNCVTQVLRLEKGQVVANGR